MNPNSSSGYEIGSASHPGLKRADGPNEDSIQVIPPEGSRPPLFILADGMGGHVGGAVASKLIVEAVASCYLGAKQGESISNILRTGLDCGWQALKEYAADHPDLISMGSTAVVACISAGQMTVANIGDSRAYLVHPGKETSIPPELKQISYDHSEVANLVRAGILTPQEALESPHRNRLTQSISPRRAELRPFISTQPFGVKDVLLLCSDGLWGVVPENIVATITWEKPPQEAADQLIEQALQFGGPDNVSVIIARRQIDRQADDQITRPL